MAETGRSGGPDEYGPALSPGADTIHGEGGADTIQGGNAGDLVYGGADYDSLFGDAQNALLGLTGNDTVFGDDGDDLRYAEQIIVSHDGQNFLNWQTRSWTLNSRGDFIAPLFRESGFWRIVRGRNWQRLIPKITPAWKPVGRIRPELAARHGLPPGMEVLCGIHDSSANFYRYQQAGLSGLAVLSTGTWIVGLSDAPAPAAGGLRG